MACRSRPVNKKTPVSNRPETGGLSLVESDGSEGQLQAKLDLPWRSERVQARTSAGAVAEVISIVGAVDGARRSRQQAGEHAARQIEVGEVEQIVEANARANGQLLLDVVVPGQ